MQWSCPHCGINLALSTEKIGNGWSFSRCYKCGGFALIRKAEINVIKVDKAPPGEKVLLPEANESPNGGLFSESATQKLLKHSIPKPPTEKPPSPRPNTVSPPEFKFKDEKPFNLDISAVPLSEETGLDLSGSRKPLVRMGVVLAAVLTLTSGYFLVGQAKLVWRKARHYTQTDSPQGLLQLQAHSVITDQLQESAMAPSKETEYHNTLAVKLLAKKATLYAGPGAQYSVVGTADSNDRYVIVDWNDRWFKIYPQDSAASRTVGWIPNSLVQTFSELPGSSGFTSPNTNPLRE